MEIVKIIDEKGNYLGQTMSMDLAHQKSLLHEAVVVFIVNSQKQILLGKRSGKEAADQGKWGLLAGHVDQKETKVEAIRRELKEEIGLDFADNEFHPLDYTELNQEKHNAHLIYFYYLKADFAISDCHMQKDELSALKWVDIDTVINLVKNNDATIITKPGRLPLFEMMKEME